MEELKKIKSDADKVWVAGVVVAVCFGIIANLVMDTNPGSAIFLYVLCGFFLCTLILMEIIILKLEKMVNQNTKRKA